MRRAAVITTIAMIAARLGLAAAAPLTPPHGWFDDMRMQSPAMTHDAYIYFRDPARPPRASAWLPAPIDPVASLTLVETQLRASGDRGAQARAAVDAFLAAATGEVIERSERVLDDRRQAEAMVRWRSDGSTHVARLVLAGDARRLVAVTAVCDAQLAAANELAACELALATLDPEVPTTTRTPLVLPVAALPPAAPALTPLTPVAPASMTVPRLPATISDGGRIALPPIVVAPRPRETDQRPIYVGAGLVLLAAVFWWNRKRRAELARADERAANPTAPAAAGGDDDDDDDADDLRSAAAGEPPKEP